MYFCLLVLCFEYLSSSHSGSFDQCSWYLFSVKSVYMDFLLKILVKKLMLVVTFNLLFILVQMMYDYE